MKKTHTTTKVLNKKTAESCNNKATYKLQISTLFFNLCFGSFIDDAKVTDFQYKETENLKTCDLKTKAKGVLTVWRFIRRVGEKLVIKKNKKRLKDTVLLDNS